MPAVDAAKPPKGWATYPTNGTAFAPWVDVRYCTSPGIHSYAKKVFTRTATGWVEVWNNTPVTVTGVGSSSAYDRITVTGTVDPNNFATTPRFYYKKSTESAYTAGPELTVLTGGTAQSVGSVTITGLVENTTYNYYLSAVSDAGTSASPGVASVDTPTDCRELGTANGWNGSTVITPGLECGVCGTRDRTVVTYTKAGCSNSPYSVTTYTTCTEDACGCATAVPPINGWSATQTRSRTVSCGGTCNGQNQYQEYRTKDGCTEVIITDWTNTGGCTDRMESYPCVLAYSGITMTIDHLYGTAGSRWVIASTSDRAVGQAAWLDAGSRCYCNAYRPSCTYATEYTLVRCPVTGTIYWSSQLCS